MFIHIDKQFGFKITAKNLVFEINSLFCVAQRPIFTLKRCCFDG